jgi:predicted outer membrane lipoprotein
MPVKDERGQAIIEFALALPVLLAAAFAIVLTADIGAARLALQHATAEAARAGALSNDDDAIRETLMAAVAPLSPDRIVTGIEPPATEPPRNGDPRGSLLTVTANYDLPIGRGFAGLPRITVSARATRRIEWTP